MLNFDLKNVIPRPLHFGTGISTVKMSAKFEILSLYSMTLRSASSLAGLNNGGGGTLPRSSLARNYAHGHGTLKKSADELR